MGYLCVIGLFVIVLYIAFCWVIGHIGDVMTGVDIEED